MAIGTCYEDDALPMYADLEEHSLTGVTLSDIVRIDFTKRSGEAPDVQQNMPSIVSIFRLNKHHN